MGYKTWNKDWNGKMDVLTRSIFWTLNNYTDQDVEDFKALECKYMCFGKEIGKENGTPHLQGMTNFVHQKSLRAFKKLVGKPLHVEPTKSVLDGMRYCKKDGIYYESGIKPLTNQEKGEKGGARSEDVWEETINLAKQGRFDDIQPRLQLQYRSTLKSIHNEELKRYKIDDLTHKHIWLYGKTRTGKNTAVNGRFPLNFQKQMGENWDGYENQQVVHINDFGPTGKGMITYLKWWLDLYPFQAKFMYQGCRPIRPELIVITSNYLPNEIWNDPSDLDPILERLDIYHLLKDQTPIIKWHLPKEVDTRVSMKDHLKQIALEKEKEHVHVDLLDAPLVINVPVDPPVEAAIGLGILAEAAATLPENDSIEFDNVDYLFDDIDERSSDDGSGFQD